MTDFIRGLVAGTVKVSPKVAWWPSHLRGLLRHLHATQVRTPEATIGVIEDLVKGAREWETLVPKPAKQGLMIEHVRLETALVDASRKNDEKMIDQIGRKLFDNATEIAAVMGIAVVEFPEEIFRRLLRDHVGLYAMSVRRKIEGSREANLKLEGNTLQLAAFTAEWF